MAHATTYVQLRAMTKDELIRTYDQIAQHTELGLGFYGDEIGRRDGEEQTAKIVAMTRRIRNLTVVITILTVLNLVAVLVSIYFQLQARVA